ncbi:MAG: hypothetical protein M3R71_05155 [Actinomycetota bacterium]|nr:hypothetical protein [Actinomycetota bacterium]
MDEDDLQDGPAGLDSHDDGDDGDDGRGGRETHTALPSKVESWRRRSAMGAVLTGFAFGLQEALETKKQEPSIMMETSGAPPTDLPVEAELEQRPARHSVVKIRPWLLQERALFEDRAMPADETQPEGPVPGETPEPGGDR